MARMPRARRGVTGGEAGSLRGEVRIGVLGLTHDHVWGNLDDLLKIDGALVVAAADADPALRSKMQSYGCQQLFEDPHELLDNVELDAAYVFSDNRHSAELAVEAAKGGLHVMVEKPMAADLAGAVRMAGAAAEHGTLLMINWPFIWWSTLQHALHIISSGGIGEVRQVHYRAAHAGPREAGCSPAFAGWLYDPHKNGSGAMMDYCSYGAALACLVLGLPSRVTAVAGRLQKLDLYAEDNAVVVMQHAAAISTSVGSWTQIGQMTSYVPTFYGDSGTLVVQHNRLWLATHQEPAGVAVEVPKPPPAHRSSGACFIHHIRSGEPLTGIGSPAVGLATQEVMEAALVSVREGRAVSLPLAPVLDG
jgi:predicted dehydrogenase